MKLKFWILLSIVILIISSLFYFSRPSGYIEISSLMIPNGTIFLYENCVFSKDINYSVRITGEIVNKNNSVLCYKIH